MNDQFSRGGRLWLRKLSESRHRGPGRCNDWFGLILPLDLRTCFAILPTFSLEMGKEIGMPRASRPALLVLCAICLAAGCGTVKNLEGTDAYIPTRRVYGGVRYDAQVAITMLGDTSGGHGGLTGRLIQLTLSPYVLLVDLPLSAIGDTLTLPLVYPKLEEQGKAGSVAAQEQPSLPK
jgi:uncharacterized protein YceK